MIHSSRRIPARSGLPCGGAFTLIETLMATSAAVILSALLLSSMISLRKSFIATAQYSSAQAGQVRLLEYVSQDLRKLSGTGGIVSPVLAPGVYTSIGKAGNAGAQVSGSSRASGTLTLTVPGYYATGKGSSGGVFICKGGSMAYGTLVSGAPCATTGTIQYFKVPQNFASPRSGADSYWKYVRVESGGATSGTTTIVEKADGMLLELMPLASNPSASYNVRVRFTPEFKSRRSGLPAEPSNASQSITASEFVMLRGTN